MPARKRDRVYRSVMATDQDGELEWVEIRRLHDPIAADIAARFLRDHHVPVRVHGGSTRALPAIGLTDIRLLVPEDDAARAVQVLEAMDLGSRSEHPFRGGRAPGSESEDEPYEAPVARRNGAFAFVLAFLVPVGAGHFYARHGAAGIILAAGIVGAFLASILGYAPLARAPLILIALDAVLSPFAVRRFNSGHVPGAGVQTLVALAAVACAILVALVAGA
jgi:hypothetical protein